MKKMLLILSACLFCLVSCSSPSGGGSSSTTDNTTSTTTTTTTNTPTTSNPTQPSNPSNPTTPTDSPTETVVNHTVRFVDENGNVIYTTTVNHGSIVAVPTNPTKTDYTFKCWYKGNTRFDFNTPINEDTELSAIFYNNVATFEYRGKYGVINQNGFTKLPVQIIYHDHNTEAYTPVNNNVLYDARGNANVEGEVSYSKYVNGRTVSKTRKFKFNLTKECIYETVNSYSQCKGFTMVARGVKNNQQYDKDYYFNMGTTWCYQLNPSTNRDESVVILKIHVYDDK